jgi:hypothetical protein
MTEICIQLPAVPSYRNCCSAQRSAAHSNKHGDALEMSPECQAVTAFRSQALSKIEIKDQDYIPVRSAFHNGMSKPEIRYYIQFPLNMNTQGKPTKVQR